MGDPDATDSEARYEHHVTGVIHEIAPREATVAAFGEAFAHERDACQAHSVVVDLRHVGESVTDDEIAVIVEHVEPDIRRWAVRLPEHGAPELAERLSSAGLEAVLIEGEGSSGPHSVVRGPR